MNLSNNRKRFFLILSVLLVCFVAAGFIKKYNNIRPVNAEKTEQNIVQKDTVKEAPVKNKKKIKFESNAEIKEEYGKLETVLLWNGKTYTGAVINTTEVYTIVTVEGTINIPMKDVKMRQIIR